MSFDADVIVAGAGPAGAVAARTLAGAGLDTLLVDRATFPRVNSVSSPRAFHSRVSNTAGSAGANGS